MMATVIVANTILDICRHCEFAFFDKGEFARVCADPPAFHRALRPELAARADGTSIIEVVDVVNYVDVLPLVVNGASALGDATLNGARSPPGTAQTSSCPSEKSYSTRRRAPSRWSARRRGRCSSS